MARALGIAGLALLALSGCAQPPALPAATARAAPARVRQPPPPRAEALIAATPSQVVAMLGVPNLRRVDGPAEVWLYSAAPLCRLDLVFFRDGAEMHVAAATARAAARTSEASCLKALAGPA